MATPMLIHDLSHVVGMNARTTKLTIPALWLRCRAQQPHAFESPQHFMGTGR